MKNIFLFLFILPSLNLLSQQIFSKDPNIITVGSQVIEKAFVNKGGKTSKFKELYLRCSTQDYYIKFCESKVSMKKMKKYIDKGLTVTYKVKEGNWDICEGDPEIQSRVGTYITILKIKKSKNNLRPKGSSGMGVRWL
tara:strand:- start:7 stop:420 length:414 start_codon:yes stop_codon:yes gene_type:complete